MLEFYIKKLHMEETILERIPEIIEVFVEFYGEDRRSEIEEKFHNFFLTSFIKQDPLSDLIIKIENDLHKRKLEILKDTLALTEEETNTYLESNGFMSSNLYGYYWFMLRLKDDEPLQQDVKERAVQALIHLHPDVTVAMSKIWKRVAVFRENAKL